MGKQTTSDGKTSYTVVNLKDRVKLDVTAAGIHSINDSFTLPDFDGQELRVSGNWYTAENDEYMNLPAQVDDGLEKLKSFTTFQGEADEQRSDEMIRKFEASLVAAGQVRNALNKPGSIIFDAGALKAAVATGMFNDIPCFVDHADFFSGGSSMRNLLGVWHDPYWDDATQTVRATLHAYATDNNLPIIQVLDAISADKKAGYGVPDIGVSIVCYPTFADPDKNPATINGFHTVESADLVHKPAVTAARLELNSKGDIQMDKTMTMAAPAGQEESEQDIPLTQAATAEPETKVTSSATPEAKEQDDTAKRKQEQLDAALAKAEKFAAEQEKLQRLMLQQAITPTVMNSDLPNGVKTRLLATEYDTLEAFNAAFDRAQEDAKEYGEKFAKSFIDNPRRPVAEGDMTTEHDRLKGAIEWMFGVTNEMPADRNYRRMDWLWAEYTGDYDFVGVYNKDRARSEFIAMPATLPNLVLDAMQKVLIDRMRIADVYMWWQTITVPTPNDGTLHDPKFISWGGMSYLPEVGDTAAYTELSMADQKESASFQKYGGYVGISRAMLKNNDISQMRTVPMALANAAVLTRSEKVAALFTMNGGVGPTMSDGKAWFHADHGSNVQTTALGTDGVALEAAQLECFNMPMLGTTKKLGMWPKYLLVPINLQTTARKLIGAGEGLPTDYNVYAEPYKDRPVIEPIVVPDWTDANDWAYIVDPGRQPIVQISYSQDPGGTGHPAPELFMANDPNSGLLFSNDMLAIKVRDEFALGVSDWRGVGKRNVT